MNEARSASRAAVREARGQHRWRLALGLSLLAAPASAENGQELRADLTCRPEAAPGRVLCELKYSSPGDARLVWADALVTSTPDFARPLRSRLTPERFGPA